MTITTAVLGGGSWGTALAHLLACGGHPVTMLVRDESIAGHINLYHENPRYLQGIPLHPSLQAIAGHPSASSSVQHILSNTQMLLLSIPCQVMRGALRGLAGLLRPDCIIVNTAKGIEVTDLVTVERILQDTLPVHLSRYAVLSGPSFALEVATNKPTAVVLGCRDEDLGAQLRQIFATEWFRSYSSTDVTGVELGGAVKNIIAIAAGLSDGLGFGLNARAALVTRGLAEISRLGVAMGARASTFMGLSGLGDLMLTCSGDLSRNRQVGLRLGAGESLSEIAASMRMVAEGVKTTQAVYTLAQKLQVEMPVTCAIHAVLYEGLPPKQGVQALMSRQLREE